MKMLIDKHKIKKFFFILLVFVSSTFGTNAFYDEPGSHWMMYQTPEEAGWSSVKLKEAKKVFNKMNASAVMVIYKGNVLLAWGDVNRRFLVHSIRKSFVSAIYGIYVKEKKININETLEELKINDREPLTETEKQAKISDLLKARSGIYIPAACETPQMKAQRPKRGSHKPGEFWYYNNWDFNVLGAILEQKTGKSVFENLEEKIAVPLGFEDFRMIDCFYNYEKKLTNFPAYLFKMSARDLCRFGLLYLMNGKWKEKQIIGEEWLKESAEPYTTITSSTNFSGYGYLWWILKPFHEYGAYTAAGIGGEFLTVFPKLDLVYCQRANTYEGKFIADSNRIKLMSLIISAKVAEPKQEPKLVPIIMEPKYKSKIQLPQQKIKKYFGEYFFKVDTGKFYFELKEFNGKIELWNHIIGNVILLPQSEKDFILEDVGWRLWFDIKKDGKRSLILTMSNGKKYSVYKIN
jgi:CubicO group peptidase (beta-lactamase class C family)